MFELCGHDWKERFVKVIRSAQENLLLCSPYITRYGCDLVMDGLSDACRGSGSVTVITDLSPTAICEGSTDPEAVAALGEAVPSLRLNHLPRLHAKAYVADALSAIVTSGNMTSGGLLHNHEYGIHVAEPNTVARIREDITGFGGLGALISRVQLATYCHIARDVRSQYQQVQRSVKANARRRFAAALRQANDELLRLRLAGGALHTVFARTVLHLLERLGPLTTIELHTRIESIHPDLCDNTIDRVIDGKRFGKKWKHAVRTAQQQLKKRGLIRLHEGHWHVVGDVDENATDL